MHNPHNGPDATGVAEVSNSQGNSLDSLSTEEFLSVVGLRVRVQRSAMSMSRKRLAEVSGVSERYLAQLESGQGNMSIALLRKVTSAIDMSLGALLSGETPELNPAPKAPAIEAGTHQTSSLPERRSFKKGTTHSLHTGKLMSDIK